MQQLDLQEKETYATGIEVCAGRIKSLMALEVAEELEWLREAVCDVRQSPTEVMQLRYSTPERAAEVQCKYPQTEQQGRVRQMHLRAEAVVTMQVAIRGTVERRRWGTRRKSATQLQCAWRAKVAKAEELRRWSRREIEKLKARKRRSSAAIRVQTMWRGVRVR